jgi:hypothetical protein
LISSQANIEEVRKVADTLTKGLFNWEYLELLASYD